MARAGRLRSGFPLSNGRANFSLTESDRWVLLLKLRMLPVAAGCLTALLAALAHNWTIAAVGLAVLVLGAAGVVTCVRRKTTWKIEIDRSQGKCLISRNSVRQPPAAVHLEVINRPLIGYSLCIWLNADRMDVEGPWVYLAASKDIDTIEALKTELSGALGNE